jgi:hypothetical protein
VLALDRGTMACGETSCLGASRPAAPGEAPDAGHAVLHTIGFEVIFFCLPAVCLLMGVQLRRIATWRGHGWYSIITGLVTVIPGVFVILSLFGPGGDETPSFAGVINRFFVVEALAWYVVMGIRILTLGLASARVELQGRT